MASTSCFRAAAAAATALLLVAFFVPRASRAESHGTVYYSGEYSSISATVPAYGLDLEGGRVTTAASRFGLNVIWGRRWYQRFKFDLYSNRGLIPREIGTGEDHRIDLASLSVLVGVPLGAFRALRWQHVEYKLVATQSGQGVNFFDYDRRRLIEWRAPIELGYDLDMIMLEYANVSGDRDSRTVDEFADGSWITGGLGATHVLHRGVWDPLARTASYVAEVEGWSATVEMKWRYGAAKVGGGTSLYAGGSGVVMGGTAMIMQAGYEAGLLVATSGGFRVRGFVGGYFWWVSGDEPTSFESDLGWQAGLRFIKGW